VRRLLLVALVTTMACGAEPAPEPAPNPAGPSSGAVCQNVDFRTCMEQRTTPPPNVIDQAKSYTATVHTARGAFSFRLDPKAAPVTVNNFVFLAQNHYYDGLTFHRVVPGFVIQGGDPTGTGSGGPGYKLPNETNPAAWVKGSVGMASSSAGVNGSQFFVLTGDAPHLASSGVYNHFGNISSGIEVVVAVQQGEKITSVEVAAQ